MSRQKQFCESDVLNDVADLFAAHGYQGTSLSMLQDATGLGKQSLYNSFGDKRALYLQAIDCALARYAAVQLKMRTAADGRAAVTAFFDHVRGGCSSDDPAERACIVAGGLLEGVEDPLIARTLGAHWQAIQETLRAAIERGQRDGSIRNPRPSAALADLLLAVMGGLRVNARAAFDPTRLRQTTDLALAVLDSG